MKKKILRMEKGDLKCTECGDRCISTSISVENLQARRHEEVKISKRGNSFMITIPKSIADALGITHTTLAKVFLEGEKKIAVEVSQP